MSNNRASIQLKNVRVNLGHYREFGPISMRVWQGNWFGLIAPSGAGKSLLIKVIVGLLQPDSGSRSIVMGIDEEKKVIPFQREQINSGLVRYLRGTETYEMDETVISFLTTRAKLRGYSGHKLSEVIDEIVDNFWLEQLVDRKFSAIPTGVRRRVAIAEKFIGNPAFVVIDDPLWGTEDFQAKNITECLKKYNQREDIGVLLSARNTNEIADLVDYVAELGESGNLIYNGSIDDWVEKRASAAVYKIVARGKGGEILNLLRRVKGVYDVLWFEGGVYNSYEVYLKDDKSVLEQVFSLFTKAKFPIVEMSPQTNPDVLKKFIKRKKRTTKAEIEQEPVEIEMPAMLEKSEKSEKKARKIKEKIRNELMNNQDKEETKRMPPVKFYVSDKQLDDLRAEYDDFFREDKTEILPREEKPKESIETEIIKAEVDAKVEAEVKTDETKEGAPEDE